MTATMKVTACVYARGYSNEVGYDVSGYMATSCLCDAMAT